MSLQLAEITDEVLDEVLCMSVSDRVLYFSILVSTYYPNVPKEKEKYQDLLESYSSSFYVEKLIRSNKFLSEKFTPVYTMTGLIRNIVLDLYFMEEDLVTH